MTHLQGEAANEVVATLVLASEAVWERRPAGGEELGVWPGLSCHSGSGASLSPSPAQCPRLHGDGI